MMMNHHAGPVPAILGWYGHCVRLSVNKVGVGGWGHAPPGKFEITSEAMFGTKKLLESPHL